MGLEKILTIEDFSTITQPDFVEWEEIERVMGKRRYNKFVKWMSGQTCPAHYNKHGVLESAVYPWDLESYLNQINKGIKEPHCWD